MNHTRLSVRPRDVLPGPPVPGSYQGYSESSAYPGGYVDDSGPDGLLEYWRFLRRRKRTLALISFLGLLAGVLLTLFQTPVYRARTSLEIQDLNDNFLNTKQVSPVSEGSGTTALTDIQTQIKLLQSENLVTRVLAKLQGHTSTAFWSAAPGPGGTGAAVRGAGHLASWNGTLNLPKRKPSSGLDTAQAANNLKVRAAGQTRIVELLYDSTDPRFAASFTNTLAQEFIDTSMEARWKMSQHTGEWLSRQLEDMRLKLQGSESALQSYARRTGLMFTSERFASEKTNIAEYRLRQLQEELSKAQSDRISRQARWEMTRNTPVDGLPDVLKDSSLRSLQDTVTELRRQRAELITTYTEKHSKVQRVEAQLVPLEEALQKERSAVVDRLRNDYEAAQRRENLLGTDYVSQSRLVTDQAEKTIQYDILKRELDSNRQLYEAMLQRVKEASIASAIRASNIRIVDLAEPPPRPFKPSLPMNSALGLLAGMFIGVAFVVTSARADRSLQDPGEAQFWVNLPELGVIRSAAKEQGSHARLYLPSRSNSQGQSMTPLITADRANAAGSNNHRPGLSGPGSDGKRSREDGGAELVSWQREPSPVVESFRSLLASILFSGENGIRPRVVVVTSANPMEGKTTIASNLGIAFAEIHHRVLIIDGDIRKPRMHEVFGFGNERGLTTLLKRSAVEPEVMDGIIFQTGIPGLFVLPSGGADQNTSYHFHGPRLPELLRKFKQEFDTVIIDTPPMLHLPDARVLGRLGDGVILVTRAGHTLRDAAVAATQCFVKDKTKILGTILNDWSPKSAADVYYG